LQAREHETGKSFTKTGDETDGPVVGQVKSIVLLMDVANVRVAPRGGVLLPFPDKIEEPEEGIL